MLALCYSRVSNVEVVHKMAKCATGLMMHLYPWLDLSSPVV